MFKSTLALITRPNLRSNPQLAAVVPLNDAIEYKVLLLGATGKELKAAVADDAGANYLAMQIQRVDFQRDLARAIRMTLPEVSRLILKPQRYTVDDIEKGITNSYPKDLEIRIQKEIVTVIPREESEKHGILLERVVGSTVYALYVDGNGKQILDMKFNRRDFRLEIAKAANLNPEAIGSLRCEARKVPRAVLDREIRQAYPEQRYEGFTQRDTRRLAQAVRKEWTAQAVVQKPVVQAAQGPQLSQTKQVFYEITASAFRQEASDVRIYYDLQRRQLHHDLFLDGNWVHQAPLPIDFSVYQSIINLAKSDAGIPDIDPHKTHDGDIHFKVPFQGKMLEFDGRICIFPYTKTVARSVDLAMITIRILRQSEEIRPMNTLGLLPFQLKMIEKFINASTGLLPVCGVMNSGKNGTLMSLSSEIHRRYPGKAFLSLEDPVETDIPFAFQTQVARHRKMKSSDYLASILRSNVQVIQMGEINDADKADFAIRAAQSGHYTQCTIHAKSPFELIPRLQMYGIPQAMLAEVLIGVIYQKLVPKLCPNCAVEEDMEQVWNDDLYPNLKVVLEHWNVDLSSFKPKRATGIIDGRPCPNCTYQGRGTGYRGRTALFEIWDASFQRKQIQDEARLGDIRATALKLNHWTILRAALCYAQAGAIDLPTAMRVYNGIDPTYEGVPGYRFEDYEKYVRDLDEEAKAYQKVATPPDQSSPSGEPFVDRITVEFAAPPIIDAEIIDQEPETDDLER